MMASLEPNILFIYLFDERSLGFYRNSTLCSKCKNKVILARIVHDDNSNKNNLLRKKQQYKKKITYKTLPKMTATSTARF